MKLSNLDLYSKKVFCNEIVTITAKLSTSETFELRWNFSALGRHKKIATGQ